MKRILEQERLIAAERDPHGCILMNMHKAKGKEFDGVVLVEGAFKSSFFDETHREGTVRAQPALAARGANSGADTGDDRPASKRSTAGRLDSLGHVVAETPGTEKVDPGGCSVRGLGPASWSMTISAKCARRAKFAEMLRVECICAANVHTIGQTHADHHHSLTGASGASIKSAESSMP